MEFGNLTTVKSDKNLLSLSLPAFLSAMELVNIHNDHLSRTQLDTIIYLFKFSKVLLGLFDGPIFAVAVLLLLSKFARPPPLLRDFDLIIFLIFFFTRDLRRLEAGMRCDLGPRLRPEVLL